MMMLVVFLLMFYPPTNAGLSMSIDGGNNQEKVKFLDFVISDDSEYDLGENIKEMSEENLHIAEVGDISGESAAILSKMESVDEDEIEMELKKADERITFTPWKVILLVSGATAGLVLLIGAIVLVLKNLPTQEYNVTKKMKNVRFKF